MKKDVFASLKERGITPIQLKEAIYEILVAIDPTESLSYLLTVDDVAERLCLHPDTVRRYCREGKIRAFKLDGGREWRIKPRDYVDFLEAKMPTPDERLINILRKRQEARERVAQRRANVGV